MRYPDCPDANSFQSGLEFQDFVCLRLAQEHVILQNTGSKLYQLRIGENLQGFEIKLDRRCTETGRLSIEIAEKSREDMPMWTPSGIYRDDNTWLYIQGNYDVFFVFALNYLRARHKSGRYQEGATDTVRKFYLPMSEAERWAVKTVRSATGAMVTA